MALRNDASRWGLVSQTVHWVSAGLFVWIFFLGFTMTDLPLSPARFETYGFHKSLGVTILTLAALRLIWRKLNPGPGLEPGMKPWEVKLAVATHHLLYLLLFAVPLVGWAYSSASAIPVSWFGLLTLPDFVPASEGLAEALGETHELLAYALLGVIGLHVAGALKHHFVAKDATLKRMVPGWR